MAKMERVLQGDFNEILNKIENEIVNGSMSASLEDGSDFSNGDVRIAVRVFERYSFIGGNRVSLNITLFQTADGTIYLSAITSGGSKAIFEKFMTVGESSFLKKLENIL